MKAIGSGVREVRIAEDGNQYRVIYYTKLKDVVYVLHAFMKKTQRTAQRDIEVAQKRLKEAQRRSSPSRQS